MDQARKYYAAMEYANEMPHNWYEKSFLTYEPQDNGTKMLSELLAEREVDDRIGLWISGKAGTGKTHLLYATMISLSWKYFWKFGKLEDNFKIYNYSDLCSMIRQEPNNFDLIRKLRKPRFLFIDDIGTSKTTDFVQEKIYSIFNYRCEHELPTFVTTNLSFTEISTEFNERMASRIKETSAWVTLHSGKDFRTEVFKENMKKYHEINRELSKKGERA